MFRQFSRLRGRKQHALGPVVSPAFLHAAAPGACYSISSYPDAAVVNDITKTRPRSVAVLGGGLTGLTTAWYLSHFSSQLNPSMHITLYEASDRLGGWLDTETHSIQLKDGRKGRLHFERGARTVKTQSNTTKYDDIVLYEMIHKLDLVPKLRYTTKEDRLQRYIYYPDHLVDVTGPDLRSFPKAILSLSKLLRDLCSEPLYTNFVKSFLACCRYRYNMKTYAEHNALKMGQEDRNLDGLTGEHTKDISIGDYFARAFGGNRDLVDNMISALVHGVYGGDVWNLSMQSSMFAGLWYEDKLGAVGRPDHVRIRDRDLALYNDTYFYYHLTDEFHNFVDTARRAEYLTFEGGLAALTDALAADLRQRPNVTTKTETPVTSLSLQGSKVKVELGKKNKPATYDKVISTLLAQTTASLSETPLPTLARQKATSIQLVNLWYPDHTLDARGFGYLVPASSKHNPQGVLGVLFDSDREAVFDANAHKDPLHDAVDLGGTKLTVMMGGHLWEGMPAEKWPDSQSAVECAKEAVSAQLGLPRDAHTVSSARHCVECIPQHAVGHFDAMARAHYELHAAFDGRLAVAGGSYQAPGVLSSVRAARDVAHQTIGHFGFRFRSSLSGGFSGVILGAKTPDQCLPNGDVFGSVGCTGLARFLDVTQRTEWSEASKFVVPFRFGNKTKRITLQVDGVGVHGVQTSRR